MAFRVIWDPIGIESGELSDVAEAATWGVLRIEVTADGVTRRLTRREDLIGRTVVDGVFGSVLPLAEWFARNWWHVAQGRRTDPTDGSRADRYAWRRVHVLSYTGDGLALPRVEISRAEDARARVVCDAEAAAPEFARVRFLDWCDVHVDAAEAREGIRAFVESVLVRLRAMCPDSERRRDLEATWAAATDRASPLYAEYVRTCQAGELWGAVTEETRVMLRSLPAPGEHPLFDAVVERIPMGQVAAWRDWAARRWAETVDLPVVRADSAFARLRKALSEIPVQPTARSWHAGWQDANRLRTALGHVGASPNRGPGLLPGLRELHTVEDPRLGAKDTVLAWREGRRPLHIVAQKPTRFLLVRDMHAPLFGPATDHVRLHSPRVAGSAAVANAFAAEWLAPIDQVRAAVGRRTELSLDDILEIAEVLRAPPECVRHQVENHELAAVVRRAG